MFSPGIIKHVSIINYLPNFGFLSVAVLTKLLEFTSGFFNWKRFVLSYQNQSHFNKTAMATHLGTQHTYLAYSPSPTMLTVIPDL